MTTIDDRPFARYDREAGTMTPKTTPRGDIRCTHGVPYWACSKMCPDPAERHVPPVELMLTPGVARHFQHHLPAYVNGPLWRCVCGAKGDQDPAHGVDGWREHAGLPIGIAPGSSWDVRHRQWVGSPLPWRTADVYPAHVTPVGGWILCALVILAALAFAAWQVSR